MKPSTISGQAHIVCYQRSRRSRLRPDFRYHTNDCKTAHAKPPMLAKAPSTARIPRKHPLREAPRWFARFHLPLISHDASIGICLLL